MWKDLLILTSCLATLTNSLQGDASDGNGHYSRCYDVRGNPQVFHKFFKKSKNGAAFKLNLD